MSLIIYIYYIYIYIKDFFCGVWNLRKEKLYPDDFLMNTASNSSVERRVVNGRNAMAKRP